jgi:hypothetical protein
MTKEKSLKELQEEDRQKRLKEAIAILEDASKRINDLDCFIDPTVNINQSQGVVIRLLIQSKT